MQIVPFIDSLFEISLLKEVPGKQIFFPSSSGFRERKEKKRGKEGERESGGATATLAKAVIIFFFPAEEQHRTRLYFFHC